ncbi:MAG: hypothetical protein ACK5UG_06785 [Synechococcaceae cyanobacterium]|jgi:hypothetical protein
MTAPTTASLPGPTVEGHHTDPLRRCLDWLATAAAHVFCDPEDGARRQPPSVGVQPFSGRVHRKRRQGR